MKYIEELEKFVKMLENQDIPEYFTKQFLDFKQEEFGVGLKKVGIIGDYYYSLYVTSYGMKPVMINGGSYFSGEYTEMFPQISDPIAKSSIGLLLDPEFKLYEELDAILIVAQNDSYKKAITYLKDMGLNVIQVEPIPYIREGIPFALYKQQLMALNDISKLVFGVFKESTFKNELKAYERAYELMQEDSFLALPSVVQTFFNHTLQIVWDKDEWCDQLEEYLQDKPCEIPFAQVTIMGSAIHLPNYKLFQIFEDLGITYFDNECQDLPNLGEIDISGGALATLKECFEFQHKNAYAPSTVGEIETIVLPQNSGGIVYYLLKGQVSEAYLADRMEELAIEQGIPFICVETDYTYTDSEQLKIRVEAFYEMLSASAKKS